MMLHKNRPKMNRTVLLLVLVVSFVSVNAQFASYDRHDISLGYGLFTPDQFMNVESSMLNDQFDDKRYVRDNFSSMGGFYLSYKHINKAETTWWGFSLGYEQNKSEIYYLGQFAGDLNRTFYTLAFEGQLRYVNKGIIQVYSGLGLGFSFGQESLSASDYHLEESSASLYRLAYQINVAGVRIGKQIAGFAEFGYGYKGIINFGLSVQLF